MKQLIKQIMPLAIIFLLTSCGNNQSNQKKQESHENHNMAAATREQSITEQSNAIATIKDDKLNAIYEHYIHLTTALTNGNVAEAKIASNAIETGANILKGGTSIAASAAKITAAPNIEVQRATYEKLSIDMIDFVKKAGVLNGELYVEFCPMALNDKGAAWLSSSKEIRNPYFGKKMLNCGEIKETIKL